MVCNELEREYEKEEREHKEHRGRWGKEMFHKENIHAMAGCIVASKKKALKKSASQIAHKNATPRVYR